MTKRFFAVLVMVCLMVTSVMAQQPPVIPADSAVRVGKLENGLTYYIRHNAKPAKQAEFYIYHYVGAMQEDDSQQGLAHFLEHMAFNGTKNFPGKNLLSYMESVGVKFGIDVNAFTSQERTVYNLSNVPMTREGILDSALLILHDWSYFVSLLPAEIDSERGVILEELRQGQTAPRRVYEELSKTVFGNTKYAYRNVIGHPEGLKSFPYKAIEDFYHRWYRTDMQAIVIVGDVDVDQVEAKIKKMMADIPKVANPVAKETVKIPDNVEPMIAVATDPELTNTNVTLYIKREPIPTQYNNTVPVAQMNVALNLISAMARERFSEISQKPNAPFLSASFFNSGLSTTCDVLYLGISARPGEAAKAFEAAYTEIEKMQRFGFLDSELERAKSVMMRSGRQAYDSRNDRRNADFVWTYLGNFADNSAMPSADYEWKLDSTIIAALPITAINQMIQALITDNNQVVTVASPAKEGIAVPTKEDIAAIITKVRAAELTASIDNAVKEPLLTEKLKGSKIKKTETDKFGATIFTLGNGAKVIIKPTDFKADEVRYSINSLSGLSIIADADYNSATMLTSFLSLSGVGKFSATDLRKQLAGKAVSVRPMIGDNEHGLQGAFSPKDIETAMQLIYLYFTAPRFEQADFDMMMDKAKAQISNMTSDPRYIMQTELMKTLYGDNVRHQMTSMERLAKTDFNTMQRVYKTLYANAENFTFTFVGNVDLEKVKPLIEMYIGSLPKTKTKLAWKDNKDYVVKGEVNKRFETAMQTPKTTALYIMSGDMTYSLENNMALNVLQQILSMRYQQSIREEKGGTYGVSVGANIGTPTNKYLAQIFFETNPAMVDELMDIVKLEINKIATNGPTAEDLSKIKEYIAKDREDALKQNGSWLNYIKTYNVNKVDVSTDFDAVFNSINADKIKALAAKLQKDGNHVVFVMNPKQ